MKQIEIGDNLSFILFMLIAAIVAVVMAVLFR